MDYVETLYNNNKLLARAMDMPMLTNGLNGLQYDTTTWANEFVSLLNKSLSSASTTLLIPDVGISTYKNMGYLIDSDMAICSHISPCDSLSSGSTQNGDINANGNSMESLEELSKYIKDNNSKQMNEVNIEASVGSVVGLFINECQIQDKLLQMIYVVRKCASEIMGIDYPIYLYNSNEGKLTKIELTEDLESQITNSLETKELFYWPDVYDEPRTEKIGSIEL